MVKACLVNMMRDSVASPRQHSIVFRVVMTLAIFAVIYNVSFQSYQSVSTGRVALVLLILCMLDTGRPLYHQHDRTLLLIFLPLPFALAQSMLVGDLGMLSRFVHLAAFSFLAANIIARPVEDLCAEKILPSPCSRMALPMRAAGPSSALRLTNVSNRV